MKLALRAVLVAFVAALAAQSGAAAPARARLLTTPNAAVFWNPDDGLLGVGLCPSARYACGSGAVELTTDGGRTYRIVLRTERGHDIAIVHSPDGAHLLNFSELDNRAFQKYVWSSLERASIQAERVTAFAADTNYITKDEYGDQLAHRLGEPAGDTAGRSDLLGDALVRLQERSAGIDARYLGGDSGGAAGGVAPLAQRAHTGVFGDDSYGELKGAYTPDRIIHLVQGRADLSTVGHEWMHPVEIVQKADRRGFGRAWHVVRRWHSG